MHANTHTDTHRHNRTSVLLPYVVSITDNKYLFGEITLIEEVVMNIQQATELHYANSAAGRNWLLLFLCRIYICSTFLVTHMEVWERGKDIDRDRDGGETEMEMERKTETARGCETRGVAERQKHREKGISVKMKRHGAVRIIFCAKISNKQRTKHSLPEGSFKCRNNYAEEKKIGVIVWLLHWSRLTAKSHNSPFGSAVCDVHQNDQYQNHTW